jgi:hypothetical protein
MRTWIRSWDLRFLVPVAIAAGVALALVAVFFIQGLTAGRSDLALIAESPVATPTASPTDDPTPTPTPTPSAATEENAQPAAGAPAPAPAQPAAPPPSAIEPGVIGMDAGATPNCGENPSGQTVYLSFSWTAREGNTVDIYYALTDGDYQATGGYSLFAGGKGVTGTVQIPRTCPVGPGPFPLMTVKVVANAPSGSATAYWSGI